MVLHSTLGGSSFFFDYKMDKFEEPPYVGMPIMFSVILFQPAVYTSHMFSSLFVEVVLPWPERAIAW